MTTSPGSAAPRRNDPLWPRASEWLAAAPGEGRADVALLGVPAHGTSLSPTRADTTPAAARAALARFSTYAWSRGVDVAEAVRAVDVGDVTDPDADEPATMAAAQDALRRARLLLLLGGDNSVTYAGMRGAVGADLARAGLVTFDAHHDLRDGVSNGSPVRRLVEAGLDGRRIAQVGIADFANSREYAGRARELGIHVVPVGDLERRPVREVFAEAMDVAGGGGGRVYVDLDVDVCDRAVAPACPASVPGGISAAQLREAAFLAGADPRVVAVDLTEVDAQADSADGRTVRLVALCMLEVAAGLAVRGAR